MTTEVNTMSEVIIMDCDEASVPDGFYRLLERTNKENPDEKDIENLKRLVEENPEFSMAAANMSKAATCALLQAIAKKQQGFRICLKTSLRELKHRMGYSEAPQLEKMIIENITICWLRLQWVECLATNHMRERRDLAIFPADEHLNNAHMRYLEALDLLARVRKMRIAPDLKMAKKEKES